MNDATPSSRSLAEIKKNPIQVFDPTPILDTGKFEQLQRFHEPCRSAHVSLTRSY